MKKYTKKIKKVLLIIFSILFCSSLFNQELDYEVYPKYARSYSRQGLRVKTSKDQSDADITGLISNLGYIPRFEITSRNTIKNVSKVTAYHVEVLDQNNKYTYIGTLSAGQESIPLPAGVYRIRGKYYNYAKGIYENLPVQTYNIGDVTLSPQQQAAQMGLSSIPLSVKLSYDWDPQTRILTIYADEPVDITILDRRPLLREMETSANGLLLFKYGFAAPEVNVDFNYRGKTTCAKFKVTPLTATQVGEAKVYGIAQKDNRIKYFYCKINFTPTKEGPVTGSGSTIFSSTSTLSSIFPAGMKYSYNPLKELQYLYREKYGVLTPATIRPSERIPLPLTPFTMPTEITEETYLEGVEDIF